MEKERDLRRMAELYLKGIPQGEIAKELALSPATVSRDLATLQSEWRNARLYDMNEAKQKELARIDVLEHTYWEAWERSLKATESEQEAITIQGVVALHGSKSSAGEPRFLQGIMSCIERRCAILGLDSPKKLDATSGGQKLTWAQFVNAQVVVMGGELPSPQAALPDGRVVDGTFTDGTGSS